MDGCTRSRICTNCNAMTMDCDPANRFGQLGHGLGDQFDLLGDHLDNLGQGLNRCSVDWGFCKAGNRTIEVQILFPLKMMHN